jgi:Reverse transcriptase (RNA-dependent DNA polymerase)/RNase H-like domain found in reverse transcriptase/Integrase zinc binding domain/Chromo (CHRromatin Organisation MOdifier) domain/gag-polyprotein putative aspartyl protease/Integrase core domain
VPVVSRGVNAVGGDRPNTSSDSIVTSKSGDEVPRNADRCIVESEYQKIQQLLGREFTFDACANDSGDNAMCSKYACPSSSFLETDVSGHHVWLNAPYTRLFPFIRHYLQCKARRPQETSACILVPRWTGKFRRLLHGMTKLVEYPTGHPLFTAPSAAGGRTAMAGIPWPVEVWYDPPGRVTTAVLNTTHSEQPLTFLYRGSTAGKPARVLLDSGASHNFVSAELVSQLGLSRRTAVSAQAVKTADGHTIPLQGQCTFKLQIQQYCGTVTALVLPELLTGVDLILGDSWLQQEHAQLNYREGLCRLQKGTRVRTLQLGADNLPVTDDQVVHQMVLAMMRARAPPPSISAKQASKALKRGANSFMVLVQPAPDSTGGTPGTCSTSTREASAGTFMCSPKCVRRDSHAIHQAIAATVSTEQPQRLQAILEAYKDVFAELPGLPPERNVCHTIPLVPGAKPPHRRMYRLSPAELEEVKRQVADLLAKGLIEPSSSPYGAPILFVQKADGSLRMVFDYRQLNKITVRDRYPIPRIEDLYDSLLGARVFSSLDLQSGYHQIRIADEDVPKTSFVTPMGSFQFRTLAFGLANCPSVFQRAMNDIFKPYIGKFVCVYLDDILIYSKTEEEHLQHLELVLQLLRKEKLYAKLRKCTFMKPELKYLGHVVSKEGIKLDPGKVALVKDWPVPKSLKELKSFLGLGNWFRKFVRGYSSLVAPLNTLNRSDTQWSPDNWGPEQQHAFDALKHALTSEPVLVLPDTRKPFQVISDASVNGTGAILMQDGKVCAYHSKKFSRAEYNYTTTEQELLGVVHALKEWRCYLEGGMQCTLVTDHNPLVYLQEQPQLSRRQSRWMEFLSRFNYKWEYRPGRINVADPISRNPALVAVATRAQAGRVPNSTVNPIMHEVLQGYPVDDWFQQAKNTRRLRQDADGLWRKGSQVVVPNVKALKQKIIREAHDAPYSGHVGRARTQELVSRTFWWPGLHTEVTEYVRTCDMCQRNKASNQLPGGLLQPMPIPDRRWQSVTMDLITALPRTTAGNDAIAVFVDRLSKMTHFVAVTTDISAKGLANVFHDTIIKLHGMPEEIISDRDPRFSSEFWRQLMSKLGTKVKMSTAFHPQTDGQTERMNRVLEDMLRHYVDPTQKDWDQHLASAEFAVNNTYNESVKATPFFLNYGDHPRTPLNVKLGKEHVPEAAGMAQRIADRVAVARMTLQQAQQRQAAYANTHRREVTYQVGTQVLLNTRNIRLKAVGTPKLLPRWVGPFKVTANIGQAAVRLELPEKWKIHDVFHVALVKPYHEGARNQPQPAPLRFDGDEPVYEVERILLHRDVRKGRRTLREFLIKWTGFGAEHNTWEPESNLLECKDALADYWKIAGQDASSGSR